MNSPVNFDVVVIGSGPGGYVAAIRATQLGLKTALVEKDPKLGGTCLHVGCIPTKSMLHSADLLEHAKKSARFGVKISGVELDFPGVQSRKDEVVSKMARGVEFLMKKNQVTVLTGHGRIAGKSKVSVTTPDGQVKTYGAKFILLATGSVVKDIPAFPVDHKTILSSDSIMRLQTQPKSMIVIGAGAVGIEFASCFHRYGTKVTVIEMMPTILPIEDEEISRELERILKRSGIDILTGTKVEQVEKTDAGVKVTVKTDKGESRVLEGETLLSAVGRSAVTGDVGLQHTNIKLERGLVPVDSFMRTTEPGVYAIGDIVATPWLAHVASSEGILAVEHMAGKEVKPINYDRVPNCTYCSPEVASVGLTEKKAKERGYEVKVGKFPFSALGKATILDEGHGMVKVIVDKKYDEVLGIHIVGPHATDLIAEGVAVLELETTAEYMAHIMHPHPTISEAVVEAVHAALGHAIHI